MDEEDGVLLLYLAIITMPFWIIILYCRWSVKLSREHDLTLLGHLATLPAPGFIVVGIYVKKFASRLWKIFKFFRARFRALLDASPDSWLVKDEEVCV